MIFMKAFSTPTGTYYFPSLSLPFMLFLFLKDTARPWTKRITHLGQMVGFLYMELTEKKKKGLENRAPGNLMKLVSGSEFSWKNQFEFNQKGGCILENWPLISRVQVFKVFSQVQYHFHHTRWAFPSVKIIKVVNFTTFDQVVLCV